MTTSCYTCSQEGQENLPLREKVWTAPGWRVAMAFNSSLPGWAVLLPTRHIEALDELSDGEAAELGRLLREVSVALKLVTRCVKTYVIMLAESGGFTHVHFHVVPRMAELDDSRRGTSIFSYLKEEPLSELRRDEIGARIREALVDSAVARDQPPELTH